MGAIGGEELGKWEKTGGAGNEREEKILVLVRLRPLSDKEIARNEVSDWECINKSTILYRNTLQERSGLPAAYSFDRVFGGDCTTRKVYEDGAKDIALSVVTGINSTIFAYGQTSSGKTYTMNGITELTVADIYDYMQKHDERAFVLKFSAIEIYNEVVRDLLSNDNTALRILDDADKGTIIEKITEETLRDWSHLKELLSICEAQRQIGETSLNETSSRSHQILRLTIESSAREFIGKGKSTTLAASVNFVDLAGSERASQALSVGQRLKEGCHINRSLLTLGTVIRKLSKGRQGHVNYRDSKLTRILQPSLGGNARTAIICTLSPARSHVEQSRNTLLFASCAQEVTTNAQVNVVMSDKALVKQLQREVARLESELRTPGPTSDYTALLRKKDLHIEKLEREVRELTVQRDLAQSRIEDLLKTVKNGQALRPWGLQEKSTREYESSDSGSLDDSSCRQPSENSSNHIPSTGFSTSISKTSKFKITHNSVGLNTCDPGSGEEYETCKEVRCIEVDGPGKNNTTEPGGSENDERITSSSSNIENTSYQDLLSTLPRHIREVDSGYANRMLENQIPEMHKTIDSVATPCTDKQLPPASSTEMSGSRNLKWTSRSSGDNFVAEPSALNTEALEQNETTPPSILENNFAGRVVSVRRRHWKIPLSTFGANFTKLSRNDSHSSDGSEMVDDHTLENVPGEEGILNVDSFVAGLKEMAKSQFKNQTDGQVQASFPMAESPEKNVRDVGLDPMQDTLGASLEWPLEFERLQRSIIELWQTCNVSLVHRTYFFLLFRGDPMDAIYMEVELRRLSFLGETFSKENTTGQDGQPSIVTSSLKTLVREKQMLSRLINKRLTKEEKNKIYHNWGISLKSKQRRLQLVHKLWTRSQDMDHISESAAIIAKLIRFSEQGRAIKAMFGLSFTPPQMERRSFGWKNSKLSLV